MRLTNAGFFRKSFFCVVGLAFITSASAVYSRNADEVWVYALNHRQGAAPYAGLIFDDAGNLYGTTYEGGEEPGGIVYTISPGGELKVLHAFKSGTDGSNPYSTLVMDKMGNLYGTTMHGGGDAGVCYPEGCGTIFSVTSDGHETVLYRFTGGTDGAEPSAGLIRDNKGNLFGVTEVGGHSQNCNNGCGTIFEFTASGAERVLHSFKGGKDGAYPVGNLIADKAGNLFGTTTGGGGGAYCNGGCGSVFKVAPNGSETVLHGFGGHQYDGENAWGNLVEDKAGDLYGTTSEGGTSGRGTVFRLAPDGTEVVLYSFAGGTDGMAPEAGMTMDKAGNLYGTTQLGGGSKCSQRLGCGTVFMLAPDGTETVLHAFTGKHDGVYPYSTLVADKAGNLYGTTVLGGHACRGFGSCGTIFELTK